MQDEQETEKITMIVNSPIPLTKDQEIQRTRKTLLIIFGIFLGLSILSTIISMSPGLSVAPFVLTTTPALERVERLNYITNIAASIAGIGFNAFAYYVTYKYHSTGLRVAAWLTIIFDVSFCLCFVVLSILFIIFITSLPTFEQLSYLYIAGILVITIIIVVSIIAIAIDIIAIKLSFKLARLIEARKSSFIRQI